MTTNMIKSTSAGCFFLFRNRVLRLPGIATVCQDVIIRNFASKKKNNEEEASLLQQGSAAKTAGQQQEWRKHELKKLEHKFQETPLEIQDYEDVQPMWKDMESRVTKRRTLTLEQRGGKSGRTNIRKTDEEAWLQAGMYDDEVQDCNDDELKDSNGGTTEKG